ncbi:MAG: hypothetical protein PHR87_01465 [Sulfurospirillaceae bacterium]|nr:hypothetical protein [Sulfurospirillaceae bacterium]
MKTILLVLMLFIFSGCATWGGIKQDAKDGAHWTKEKVNQGADWVKEKTE